ncbi:MAG: ATP-dependent DNA helicase RecG [Candidatus Omnitrophica bacterium]|nr:ATP-dependent DNA helicase RecG [Candidatus Omnitrophota bacterium]
MQEKNRPIEDRLKLNVRYLKGVGPRKAEQLSRLGISTAIDLLYCLPRRYEDRREIRLIRNVEPGGVFTIKGTIRSHGIWKTKKGMLVYEMVVNDGTGSIHGVWYNQPYLKRYFTRGAFIILYGKVESFRYLQMTHPDYEVLKKEEEDLEKINMGRIVPIYPLTQDITQKYLRSLIYREIEETSEAVKEIIPTHIRARHKLADIAFALKNIHFPHKFENLKRAYDRIVFEEFFVLETTLAIIKDKRKRDQRGIRHEARSGLFESFKKMLPFRLTEEQITAIKAIEKDMQSDHAMNRLLQGEVGSGKTVVSMYAMFLTIKNGFQAAIMVPTETLAQQHYLTISEFFMPLGISVRLIVGSTSSEAKNDIKEQLRTGKVDIIIGTHSLIQQDVSFDNVGLVIIDEQHKFGVSQRSLFRKKGRGPDVLIMTATPIPRTLAITVYGDLDVSTIKGLPEGRVPVSTYWVEDDRKDKVYRFISEEVAKGHQAYIVCPRIEEDGRDETSSAKALYEHLKNNIFPDLKLALLHGRLAGIQKDKITSDFKKNKINILVSTVVIEVGIDHPNATCMVIESADRFGLAQLHQLRGRVGRGEHKSYCILISDPKNEAARRRLEAFERTQDGFELAEEDLIIRGPGEVLGVRQHGLPEIRFGDMAEDKDLLELARTEAFQLVAQDRGLRDERNRNLREFIIDKYKGRIKTTDMS